MSPAGGGWRFWNVDKLLDQLAEEPEDVQDAVLDALELLEADPYDPIGLVTHVHRGRRGQLGWRVAHFPADLYLAYRPCPDGLPPIGGKFILLGPMIRLAL